MASRKTGSFIFARYVIAPRPNALTSMRPADGELDRIAQSMFPRGSGEQFEGVAGHCAIMPGALDGVFERAVLLHRRQRKLEIAIGAVSYTHLRAHETG